MTETRTPGQGQARPHDCSHLGPQRAEDIHKDVDWLRDFAESFSGTDSVTNDEVHELYQIANRLEVVAAQKEVEGQ